MQSRRIDDGKAAPRLDPPPSEPPSARPLHAVHVYEDDNDLLPSLAGYISAGMFEDCVTIIATPEHRSALVARLEPAWVHAARAEDRFLELDAADTLGRIMRDGAPDPGLFDAVLGARIRQAFADHQRARGYGEMVGLLWADGQHAAALALEDLWNGVQERHPFPMLCAYPRKAFAAGADGGLDDVCARHTQLLMAG